MKRISIRNNLLYANGDNTHPNAGGILQANKDAEDVEIFGNLCSDNVMFQIALRDEAQAVVDMNLIDGFRGASGEIKGTNYFEFQDESVLKMYIWEKMTERLHDRKEKADT